MFPEIGSWQSIVLIFSAINGGILWLAICFGVGDMLAELTDKKKKD